MVTKAVPFQNIVTTFNGTVVEEVTAVPTPQMSTEDIEVTSQDSLGYKEFIAGLKEGNEVEFKGNYSSTYTGQAALRTASDAGATGLFCLTFTTGDSVSFYGAVKTFDYIDNGKALGFSCKAKVTGKPTYGSDVVQLSALTTTGGTLFPTFAAGTYKYTIPVAHATATCTITPTSAGATITVDGTEVASAAASGNLALTDAAITEYKVIVTKAAKTPTVYTLVFSRAAS